MCRACWIGYPSATPFGSKSVPHLQKRPANKNDIQNTLNNSFIPALLRMGDEQYRNVLTYRQAQATLEFWVRCLPNKRQVCHVLCVCRNILGNKIENECDVFWNKCTKPGKCAPTISVITVPVNRVMICRQYIHTTIQDCCIC